MTADCICRRKQREYRADGTRVDAALSGGPDPGAALDKLKEVVGMLKQVCARRQLVALYMASQGPKDNHVLTFLLCSLLGFAKSEARAMVVMKHQKKRCRVPASPRHGL